MDLTMNRSMELDYDIFYSMNLNKNFANDINNIFNCNLESIEKLKESFDFKNFSFENFFQLLKLFEECDTQRKVIILFTENPIFLKVLRF